MEMWWWGQGVVDQGFRGVKSRGCGSRGQVSGGSQKGGLQGWWVKRVVGSKDGWKGGGIDVVGVKGYWV